MTSAGRWARPDPKDEVCGQGAAARQPRGRPDRIWRLTSWACRKQRYPLSQHPDIRQLPLRRPGMHLQACGSDQGILSARLVSRDMGPVKPICFGNIARAERLQTHYAPCLGNLDKGDIQTMSFQAPPSLPAEEESSRHKHEGLPQGFTACRHWFLSFY